MPPPASPHSTSSTEQRPTLHQPRSLFLRLPHSTISSPQAPPPWVANSTPPTAHSLLPSPPMDLQHSPISWSLVLQPCRTSRELMPLPHRPLPPTLPSRASLQATCSKPPPVGQW